jgi:hypothetical protein
MYRDVRADKAAYREYIKKKNSTSSTPRGRGRRSSQPIPLFTRPKDLISADEDSISQHISKEIFK